MTRRIVAILGITLAIAAGAWAWTDRRPPPLQGGIVLTRLQCASSQGVATVNALATNDTNRKLDNLIARVTIGASGTMKTADTTFDRVAKGGSISIQKSFTYPNEIDACLVKFWWNGAQLPTAFRP